MLSYGTSIKSLNSSDTCRNLQEVSFVSRDECPDLHIQLAFDQICATPRIDIAFFDRID